MTARKVAGTPADPTIKPVDIIIGGKPYALCFDLDSLAEGERAMNREGVECNLLAALPNLTNLSNVRIIFACAIRRFHPEMSFQKAVALVKLDNVYVIANKIAEAWQAAMPEPEPVPEEAVTE
jgi:hypothetical protein